MRIKNIVIPIVATTILIFGLYGCGSEPQEPQEPEVEQTVEQTDNIESETDTEDTAEVENVEDTTEQPVDGDTSVSENTTTKADTTESADTNDTESTTIEEESGVTVNSTHDDVQLGDDEYKGDNEIDGAYDRLSDEEKAEVDQILEEVKKEHPELFEDNGGDNKADNYMDVQGPVDTGELTNPDSFGHGDYSEGAGLTVY